MFGYIAKSKKIMLSENGTVYKALECVLLKSLETKLIKTQTTVLWHTKVLDWSRASYFDYEIIALYFCS